MSDRPDFQRLFGDLVRIGTIASVDHDNATCRVSCGDFESPDLQWLTLRAGKTLHWSPPSIGEQVAFLSPEGDVEGGIVLLGLYSDANAPFETSADVVATRYPDGAIVSYDHAAHHLEVELPVGATLSLTADGGLTITGDVGITGDLSVTGDLAVSKTLTAVTDVVGGGKSLKDHKHLGVAAGTSTSGPPQ